jgi:hypothetical protein
MYVCADPESVKDGAAPVKLVTKNRGGGVKFCYSIHDFRPLKFLYFPLSGFKQASINKDGRTPEIIQCIVDQTMNFVKYKKSTCAFLAHFTNTPIPDFSGLVFVLLLKLQLFFILMR